MSHDSDQCLRYDAITGEAVDFEQIVASKLRDLEVANQRLREEKHSLQKQLDHVLSRLAGGRMSEFSPAQAAESLKNLEQIIKRTIRISTLSEKYPQIADLQAPLATLDANGLSDSMSFKMYPISQDYSSLSDTYEEYCLVHQDFTDSIRLSGLSQTGITLPDEMILGSHHVFHRSRKDSFGNEEAITFDSTQQTRLEGHCVSATGTGTGTMLISGTTIVDSVASSSKKSSHENSPASVATGLSSQFIRAAGSKLSKSSSSSSSSVTTDEEMEMEEAPIREGSMDIQPLSGKVKMPTRSSSSLPGSLQFLSSIPTSDRAERIAIQAAEKKAMLTSEGEQSRQAPPSVQITRKKFVKPFKRESLSSSISSTSLADLPVPMSARKKQASEKEKVQAHKEYSIRSPDRQSKLPKELLYSPMLLQKKEQRTPEQEYFHRIYKHIYMTQPTIKIGRDSNFLNNFQKFPCLFSSELKDFQPMDLFVNEPGLGSLIKYYETFTIAGKAPCLVQRTPISKKTLDFKKELQVIVNKRKNEQVKEELALHSNTIVLMDSSSDVQSVPEVLTHMRSPKSKRNGDPMREAVSQASLEYFFPPNDEENGNNQGPSVYCSVRNDSLITNGDNSYNKHVLYSGYLSKLGNKFKIWHRFWCKLNSVSILFYDSEQSVCPAKSIELDQIRTIIRPYCNIMAGSNTDLRDSARKGSADQLPVAPRKVSSSVPAQRRVINFHGSPLSVRLGPYRIGNAKTKFFEVLLKDGKLHTFRSESPSETERWLIELRKALKRSQAEAILEENASQFLIEGWLKRIKSGQSKKVWCKLFGNHLIYYKSPTDKVATGFRTLLGTKLRLAGELCDSITQPSPLPTSRNRFRDADSEMDLRLLDQFTNNSDSDSDTAQNYETEKNRTFSLWTANRDPVYLIPPNDVEFKKWHVHLSRACSDFPMQDPADKQQATGKLTSIWLLYWAQLVRQAHAQNYCHSRQIPVEPLSKTTDIRARNLWRGLFEYLLAISYPSRQIVETLGSASGFPTCQYTPRDKRYTSAKVSQKYSLLHTIVMTCFSNPDLKDELYLQLMKQCTPPSNYLRGPYPLITPDSSKLRRRRINALFCGRRGQEDSFGERQDLPKSREPSPENLAKLRTEVWAPIIAMWECLCLLITVFLPSPMVCDCLEYYLQRFPALESRTASKTSSPMPARRSSQETQWVEDSLAAELGRYAAFCREMLHKTKFGLGRSMPPSGLEVTAISIRNPYTHALPFSLPFYLPSPGTYEIVSFDGTTKIGQILHRLAQQLGLMQAISLDLCKLALYVRIPRLPYILYLHVSINICDVISSYEQIMSKLQKLKPESAPVELCIRIQAFSNKLFQYSDRTVTTPVLKLLANQFQEDLVSGTYCAPFRGVDLMELIGHSMRLDFGKFEKFSPVNVEAPMNTALQNYLPINWIQVNFGESQSRIQLTRLIMDYWSKVSGYLNQNVLEHEQVAYAGISYLNYLKRISPHRFCPRIFAARMINSNEIESRKVIWVAPLSDKVHFLTIHRANKDTPTNTLSTVRSLKSVSIDSIVSYGVQNPTLFFLVHKSWDFEQVNKSRQITPCRSLKKIHLVLCDPCSALELCSTLSFYVTALHPSC